MNQAVRYFLYCGLTALISMCGGGKLYCMVDSLVDNLPPVINITSGCGSYTVQVTELRNLGSQRDTGIIQAPWLWAEHTKNFEPLKLRENFHDGEVNYNFQFDLRVQDPFQDAHTVFLVVDRNGNRTVDSINYEASKLDFSRNSIDFESVRLGSKKQVELTLTNPFNRLQFAPDIKFSSGKNYFSASEPTMAFEPGQSRTLTIEYAPTREAANLGDYDRDTLLVYLRCYVYRLPLVGLGVKPHIEANDFDAGVATVGSKQCMNYELQSQPREGFRIRNTGTDYLIITSLSVPDKPFVLSNPTNPDLPIVVPPESDVKINDLCFVPTEPGVFTSTIVAHSNATDADSIIKLTGIALPPGAYMQNVDFYEKRVGSKVRKNFIVHNSGDGPVFITGFELSDTTSDFKIITKDINPQWTALEPIVLYPETSTKTDVTKEVIVPVEFSPRSEYGQEVVFRPIFHAKSGVPQGSSWARLRGFGILPKVAANGYSFNGIATVNTTHPETGKVVIRSVSQTADLFINKIEISSPGPVAEFKFKTPPPNNFVLSRGDSIELNIEFSPAEEGDRSGAVVVYSDAADYRNLTNVNSDTTVYLRGWGLNKGLAKSRIYFPDAMACFSSATTLTLKNPNKTFPLKIFSIKPYSEDTSYFGINYDFSGQPVIAPSDSLIIPVEFHPSGSAKKLFQAGFKIFADRDTAVCVFVGHSNVPTVNVKTNDVPRVVPGESIGPYGEGEIGRPYSVSASSGHWGELNVDSFRLVITYSPENMRYADFVEPGDAIAGWMINAKEVASGSAEYKLIVEASGPTPIAHDGILFKPKFQTLLGKDITYKPEISSLYLSSPGECYSVDKYEGSISAYVCGDFIRSVEFGVAPYSLDRISPNPVSKNRISIDYTVAFKERAQMDLLDARGSVVMNILNEERPAGKNKVEVDVTNLANSVYFLRFHSGPYTTTLPILIEK